MYPVSEDGGCRKKWKSGYRPSTFDGDGISDTSKLGRWVEKNDESSVTGETITVFEETSADEAELQGVWLSSNGDIDPKQPDLTRLMDWSADFEDRALLSQISTDDLQNTDIYVFRESNGQLVAERRGLTDNEYLNGVNDSEGKFFFTLHMVGRYGDLYRRGEKEFEQWQAKGRVNPALHKRASDHLRPGERVRIVAINRATGYTGSTITTMEAAGASGHGQQLSFHISDITMTPPNLKIWAERNSTVDYGMTKGERREQTIGNEGAGLGTDDTITIYSEWLDQNGRPLPDELGDYGYTGRIALVVAPNTLGAGSLGSQVSQFPIKPGRQLQVIRLPEKVLAAQHVYIQVSGEPNNRHPDFSSTGLQEGILKYRPDNFVPFKVPVYDEKSSLLQQQAYKKAKQEQPGATLTHPKPVYQWAYRPELQFSIYDLLVDEARREDADNNSQDILDSKTPLLSSADAFLKILYDLQTNSNNPLEAYSYNDEKELVFALGEQELKATVTKGAGDHQKLEFDDLSVLANLEAEDYLSLRLYTNNDAGNILWEWAFEFLALDTQLAGYDAASGDTLYVSADDPVVPLQAILAGYLNRDPAIKKPVRVSWNTSAGYLEKATEMNETTGVFFNEVNLPTEAGTQANVSIHMIDDPQAKAYLPPFEVVPGAAASSSYTTEGSVDVAGVGVQTVTFTPRDQFGNKLLDNTGVSFLLSGSLEMVSADDAITNGSASVVVKGAGFEGPATITFQVENHRKTVDLNVQTLNIELNMGGNLLVNQGRPVSVTVTDLDGNPVAGVPVNLGAQYGYVKDRIVTTGDDGTAMTAIKAPGSPGPGVMTAQVGFQPLVSAPFEVAYAVGYDGDIEVNNLAMVGDQPANGKHRYQRYDGTVIDVPFRTRHPIRALGEKGEDVTIRIGDLHDPNRSILAAWYMNDFDGTRQAATVTDETGQFSLNSQHVDWFSGTRMGMGNSFRFRNDNPTPDPDDGDATEPSALWVRDLSALKQPNHLGFTLEILPDQATAGELVNLDQGVMRLAYGNNQQLELQIRTTKGKYTVTSEPLSAGRWHQIAARYHNGRLELSVNHQLRGTDASGDLAFDQNTDDTKRDQLQPDRDDLVVGMGFNGQLNSFKWYDWSSAPVATFADGTVSTTVTLKDDTGSMPVEIVSTGNLRQGSSQLNLQRIAIHTDKVRQYGTLISAQTFGQIAEQYTDTLSTTAPPINPDGLLASYSKNNQGYYVNTFAGGGTGLPLSSVMPQAHAGFADFAWGLVDFLLPIESIKEVVVQLSYLVTDPDKFEMDIFIVSAVDVLTIFPVAKPLKLFTTPLKAMMRFMPKKMRPHFARALKQVMNRAKKGDFDVLWNLLPFMVLTAEMMSDEEMRKGLEFMFSTVNSAEDMLSWVDYLALPAGGWEGDELPEIDPFSSAPDTAALPLSFVVGQAYAGKAKGFRISSSVITASLSKVSKRILDAEKKNLPQALGTVAKQLKELDAAAMRKYAHSPSMLTAGAGLMARQGAKRLRNFLKTGGNARYKAPEVLAMMAFTEWQMACGKVLDQKEGKDVKDPIESEEALDETLEILECNGKGLKGSDNRAAVHGKIYPKLLSAVARGNSSEILDDDGVSIITPDKHGALFHLAMFVQYQLAYLTGLGKPVKAIEGRRVIWLYNDEGDRKIASRGTDPELTKDQIARKFVRFVDLIIGENDDDKPEQWIELKSYAAVSEKEPTLLKVLNKQQNSSKRRKTHYIEPWDTIAGGDSKIKVSNNASFHKQFSLDRATAFMRHARLKFVNPKENRVNPRVIVSPDFLWLFQKFKTKWKVTNGKKTETFSEQNVSLGSNADKKTVLGSMGEPVTNSHKGGKNYELAQANMGLNDIDVSKHIKLADKKALMGNLKKAGFEEAVDALTEDE